MNRPLSFFATFSTSFALCAAASAQSPDVEAAEAFAPKAASKQEPKAPVAVKESSKQANKAGETPDSPEATEKQEEEKPAPEGTQPAPSLDPKVVPRVPGRPPGDGTAVEVPAPTAEGAPRPLPESAGSSLGSPAIVLPHDSEAIDSEASSAMKRVTAAQVDRSAPAAAGPPQLAEAPAPSRTVAAVSGAAVSRADTGVRQPVPPSRPLVGAWVGIGTTIMRSEVFDPFSVADALSGVALGATLAPPGLLPEEFSLVGAWQYASSEASLRGEATRYSAQRVSLGVEVGSELISRIDYYLRVSAAGVFAHAQLEESSSGVTLEDRMWAVGAEGVAGLQWRIASVETNGPRSVQIYARVEGGLLWVPDRQVKLTARNGVGPVRLSPVRLGPLDMGGDQLRFALGWSY